VVGGRVVVGGSVVVGGRVVVGGSVVVGGRVEVDGRALVGVDRVGRVAVWLGDSVTLGAGRVPERSVDDRVDETLPPPPVPQPSSSRTIPINSPARTHAFHLLLAGAIGREVILHIRIDASPLDKRGQLGSMSRRGGRPFFGGGPPAASPEAGENAVPVRADGRQGGGGGGFSGVARPARLRCSRRRSRAEPLVACISTAATPAARPHGGMLT
jgi:hypothetical protein